MSDEVDNIACVLCDHGEENEPLQGCTVRGYNTLKIHAHNLGN